MRIVKTATATAAVALSVAGIAACGNSDSPSSETAGSTVNTPAAGSGVEGDQSAPSAISDNKVTIAATEYAFAPAALSATAGKVDFTLQNDGAIEHELVVLKTNKAPADLKEDPKTARVSESRSIGEVSETAAGATKSATLDLEPGKYLFVCNIAGHYKLGMTGTLTVK